MGWNSDGMVRESQIACCLVARHYTFVISFVELASLIILLSKRNRTFSGIPSAGRIRLRLGLVTKGLLTSVSPATLPP